MENRTHIVTLSGGKDSAALALRLQEVEPRNYVYICTPTGDELPEMEQHWKKLSVLLGQPILRLRDPRYPTIFDLIDHFQALPNFRQRWCTRILKIETAQMFYEMVKPAVIYVGLRADEEKRQGNKLFDANIEQRHPMQEWGWGIDDVWQYLNHRGVEIPRRTDCAMCFFQRIGEWWMLWKEYPDIYQKWSKVEDKIGKTLMTPGKHKIWPHKLSELAIEFEKGRLPREIKSGKERTGCRVCNL
jgi:3'-phosphoadenosine 5'-phosphosulfate sulfotransferase (PAPS reductase)/FAD synthetase